MECSDGGGQCECEHCKTLGSISDRVFGLAASLIRAAFAAPELSPAFRAAFAAWAVAVAGLPSGASEPLIRLAFSPGQRPGLLNKLMKARF